MFCAKCGKELEEGSKVCPDCGWKADAEMKTEREIPPAGTGKESQAKGREGAPSEGKETVSASELMREAVGGYVSLRMRLAPLGAFLAAVISVILGYTGAGVAFLVSAVLLYPKMAEKFEKKKWIRTVGIVASLLIAVLLVSMGEEGDKYIKMVKNAEPESEYYEGISYGDAFDEYFDDESWEYFVSDNEQDVVEFRGTYESAIGREEQFLCQFVCEPQGYVTVHYMSVGGSIYDDYAQNIYLEQIFDYYLAHSKKY